MNGELEHLVVTSEVIGSENVNMNKCWRNLGVQKITHPLRFSCEFSGAEENDSGKDFLERSRLEGPIPLLSLY